MFAALTALVTLVSFAVAAESGAWKQLRALDAIEVPVSSPANHRLSICVDQRDLDLALSLSSESASHAINATVFGRECIHAVSEVETEFTLKVEAADKRYGHGAYRIASVTRTRATPADESRMLAQERLQEGTVLAGNPNREPRELALRKWADAVLLARKADDPRREAEALSNRGALLHSMGRYPEALEDYRIATILWTRIGDPFHTFLVQADRERIQEHLGRHITAAKLRVNLGFWQRFGDRRGIGSVYRGLAQLAMGGNEYEAASSYLARADRLCAEIQDIVCLAKVVERQAMLAGQLGDDARTKSFLVRRLELAKQLEDERGVAAALAALADHEYRQGGYPTALAKFWEVRRLRIAQGDEPSVAGVEANISAAYRRLGDHQESLKWAEASLARFETLHSPIKGVFLRSEVRWGWVLENYLETLAAVAEASPEEACRLASMADQARSRFLLNDANAPPPDIRRLMESGDVALLLAHTAEATHVWVIEPSKCSPLRFPHPGTLRIAMDWRKRVIAGTATPALHREVSERLLGAVLGQVRASRLLISPTGEFSTLPFAALLDPETGYTKPLGETREIVYVPSFTHLAVLRDAWSGRGPGLMRIAAFGDPVYETGAPRRPMEQDLVSTTRSVFGTTALPRLPFSRREVKYVMEESGGRTTPFLGYAAKRAALGNVLPKEYDGLHVAVHGLVNAREPEKSGLVLSLFDAGGKRIPGYFRLTDILQADRKFRLVVLSSCQTALGKPLIADASLGLTSAFLRAGARTVVSSLWKVDDEATSITMKHFYRAYFRDGLAPAAALAAAQRKIRSVPRWRHPYYWAGFVVTGDWQR
jgi:tetratricopeptide (TPR) repeat protein